MALSQASYIGKLKSSIKMKSQAALFYAVLRSDLSGIKLALSFGADVNGRLTEHHDSLLHDAVKKGNLKVINYLVDRGADAYAADFIYGATPFHMAAKNGDLNIVEYFIDRGIDINVKDRLDKTPLHYAIEHKQFEVCEFLAKNGADLNVERYGRTPLFEAIEQGDLALANTLLALGADVNYRDALGRTALQISGPKIDMDFLRVLVSYGADINEKSGNSLTTITHDAARHARLDMLEFLIESGADINSGPRYDKPLDQAVLSRDVECIKYLVANGADISYRYGTPFGRFKEDLANKIIEASKRGDIEAIDNYLLQGASLDALSGEDHSALHEAFKGGHLTFCDALINRGADKKALVIQAWKEAALSGDADKMQFLFDHGIDVNSKDVHGRTPLYYAAEKGDLRAIGFLSKFIGLMYDENESDILGYALPVAMQYRKFICSKVLIRHGANTNSADALYGSALMIATRNGHQEMVSYLLSNGADIGFIDSKGRSALHEAAYRGDVVLMKYFLNNCGNDQAKDGYGKEPLVCIAAERGHVECLRLLVEHDANLNAENSEGYSPIFIAANRNNIDMMKYLIEHGVDIHSTGSRPVSWSYFEDGDEVIETEIVSGYTVLHIAAENGDVDTVLFLLENGANPLKENGAGDSAFSLANSGMKEIMESYLAAKKERDTLNDLINGEENDLFERMAF